MAARSVSFADLCPARLVITTQCVSAQWINEADISARMCCGLRKKLADAPLTTLKDYALILR